MSERVVWRYQLAWTAEPQELKLPHEARLLHVGTKSDGNLHLWFEVEVTHVQHPRWFQIFGTGDGSIPHQADHRGSAVIGDLVWHVYELLPGVAP